MRLIRLAFAATLTVLAAVSAAAQDALPRHVTTSVGLFQYQLTRSGYAPMVAVRGSIPTSSVLLFEGGLVASRPQQQVGGGTVFLAPEGQLQLVLPFERILPYMGLGAGAVFDFRSSEMGGMDANFTVSASIGVRAWLLRRGGFQVEYRGRGIGYDFDGTSSEYTAGMIWRL